MSAWLEPAPSDEARTDIRGEGASRNRHDTDIKSWNGILQTEVGMIERYDEGNYESRERLSTAKKYK